MVPVGKRWAGVVLTRCTGTGDEPLEISRPCAPCRTGASCTCRTLSEQPHYAQQCARWVQVATLDFKATIEPQISQNGKPAMQYCMCAAEMRPIVWGSTDSGHCVQMAPWRPQTYKAPAEVLLDGERVDFPEALKKIRVPGLSHPSLPWRGVAVNGNLEGGNSRSWGPTTEEVRLTP